MGMSNTTRAEYIKKMKEARDQCFCILFEMSFNNNVCEDVLANKAEVFDDIVFDDYTLKIIDYYTKNSSAIDKLIEENLKGWTFSRVSKVPLAVLRMALCELECYDTPEKVVINEAIDIAKKYSSPKEGSFVNAVLGAVLRKRKEDDKGSKNEQ